LLGDVVGAFKSISTIAVNRQLFSARGDVFYKRIISSTSFVTPILSKRFAITSSETRLGGGTIPKTLIGDQEVSWPTSGTG